ncbi:MAG: glycosyltransferase family 4 protein [Gammaproteobacteria bacterium]|nr:glycosyltransferase family 4 protein [Gammaproteobacteria bacterium]
MLRVLQVYKTNFPEVRGGVDQVVCSLLRQAPADCRCSLLRTAPWTQRAAVFDVIEGIDVISMHLPVPPARATAWMSWWFLFTRAPRALWQLRSVLRAQGVDVVHLHTLQFYQLYFVLCRVLGGPPLIVTLHRAEVLEFEHRHWLMRACWQWVLQRASAVNAVSAWLCAEAQRRLPFVTKIECITNGIAEPPDTLPDGAVLRRHLGLPDDYVCMVGVLEHYKGHDLALRCWAELDSDVALVLIGNGSAMGAYQDLCARLGLSQRVHLLGQLPHDETLCLLRDSRAMLMPSRNEGLGLAILEAGLLGVPVIASDIAPFQEMLRHEHNGLLFRSDDSHALTDCVRRLLGEPALGERLARQFGADVRAHFSFADNARRYGELYQRAVRDSGQQRAS